MNNELLSLSKVFTERIFRIPDYQRGYAWQRKHLEDFWSDLDQLEDGRSHYAGVLTLEPVPPSSWSTWEDDRWIIQHRGFAPFFVVDGQQRLTTSLILLQCILETASQPKLNFTDTVDVRKRFVFESKDDGISRSYLFGYEKDNPSYEHLKTAIFGEHSPTKQGGGETAYTDNLDGAKSFFLERLRPMTPEARDTLFRRLTQQLLFNIFSIADDVEVCVAFETMNNRGKPLSTLELLKNRLIYLTIKIPSATEDRDCLRRTINECWKSVYHLLGQDREHPLDDDQFLHAHFIVYFGAEFLQQDPAPSGGLGGPSVSELADEDDEDDEDGDELAGLSLERIPARNVRRVCDRLLNTDFARHLLGAQFTVANVARGGALEPTVGDPPDRLRALPATLQTINAYANSLQKTVRVWHGLHSLTGIDLTAEELVSLQRIRRLRSIDRPRYGEPDPAYLLMLAVFQKIGPSAERAAFLVELEVDCS